MAAGSHAVKSFAPLAEKPTGTTGAKRVAQDGQTETESKEKEMADHQNAQKRARVDGTHPYALRLVFSGAPLT
jgi:precorrin-6x reductase